MVIHSALEKISENNAKELKTHIFYAGNYFYDEVETEIINSARNKAT